jgi:hypothetical protein
MLMTGTSLVVNEKKFEVSDFQLCVVIVDQSRTKPAMAMRVNLGSTFKRSILVALLSLVFTSNFAQSSISVDGKTFTRYQAKYFKPHRGIFYTLYLSPVITVDPLALGGKSTYGIAMGSRFRIWENYSADSKLGGLKMKGVYTSIAYEYYPQQYSKTYGSLWFRVQNFLPIAFKADLIYARGYGLQGITYRFGIGVEVKNITLFLCGEYYIYNTGWGPHPNSESPYTNAGELMLTIPVFNRRDK